MTGAKHGEEKDRCRCPYCDAAAQETLPICQACGAEIVRCARCGRVLAQGEAVCPGCGSEVKRSPAEQR